MGVKRVVSDNDLFVCGIMNEERTLKRNTPVVHTPFNKWKLDRTIRLNQATVVPPVEPPWLSGLTKGSPRKQLVEAAASSIGLDANTLNLVMRGEEENDSDFLFRLATQVRTTDTPLKTTIQVNDRALAQASVGMSFPPAGVPPTTSTPAPIGRQTGYEGPKRFRFWEMLKKGRKKAEVLKFIEAVKLGRSTSTVIVNSEDVFPKFVGHQFDIDSDWWCSLTNTADEVVSEWTDEDGVVRDRAADMLEAVGGEWKDQAMVYMFRFGFRFNVDIEWALVLSPPLASANDHKEVLDATLKKQEGRGYYTASVAPLNIPGYYSATGAAAKKWKLKIRPTLDLSGPRDPPTGPTGRPYAVNAAAEDSLEGESIEWVRASHHRQASGLIYKLYREIADIHPECERHLRPTGSSEDCEAFFNQFKMAAAHRHLQGTCFPQPAGEPRFYRGDVLCFGGTDGPMLGQRVAFMQTAATRRAFWDWEMMVHDLAEKGHREAQLIAPAALRDWVTRRRATLGVDGDSLPFWCSQYIGRSYSKILTQP